MFWRHGKLRTSEAQNKQDPKLTKFLFRNTTERTLLLFIELEAIEIKVPAGGLAEVYFEDFKTFKQQEIEYAEDGWVFYCDGGVSHVNVDGERVFWYD